MIPNYQEKYDKKSIFTGDDFISYARRIQKITDFFAPKSMILSYSRQFLDHIITKHPVKEVTGFAGETYIFEGQPFGIIGRFGIGAPAAVNILETMIAWGAERFLSIGTAGALQSDLDIGSLVLCDRAIRDEGTSYHYMPPSKYAQSSELMVDLLESALKKNKLDYTKGTSWTIDAVFRETEDEVKHYQNEGVLTVEMEASALFAAAKYHNVEIGTLFAISDSLADMEWRPEFHHDLTRNGLEQIFRVAFDVLGEGKAF